MRTRSKIGIGCLGLVGLILIASVALWFFAPGPPEIRVDDPGEGGIRITINERPANFFAGSGEGPRPAVIMLGGSEGGLREGQNAMARELAAEGFSVLYPGYYRTSEASKSFNMVPLETFDAALAWLQAREDIDPDRIAIMGASKGGEGALLYASRNPSIRAVIGIVPSNVVWQGFDWTSMDMSQFSSSWSVDGEPLPYVPYVLPEWYEWFTGGGVGLMYSNSLDQASNYPDAFIRVEDINGPVLLMCGDDDALWPSCRMSRALAERSEAAGKDNVEVAAYPNGGHMIFGRPLEPDHERFEELAAMGGTPEGNNAARRDGLTRIVAFLKSALEGSASSGSAQAERAAAPDSQ